MFKRLKPLLHYLKPYTRHCILGPAFKFAEAVLELYLPLLMAQVIDKGVLTGDTAYIVRMGGIMLLVVTVGLLCALICQYVASVASQGYGTQVRNALFSKILHFSHAETDRFGAASLINRVTGDVNQLQYAVAMLIRLVVRAPFLAIGGIVMAVTIDWHLSLVMVVAVPLFVLVIWLVMKTTVVLHRDVQKKLDTIARVLRENLSGIRVIRAFARTRSEQQRFQKAADEHMHAAIRVGRLSAILNPATQLIMNAAILAIVWIGGFRVESGRLTTGEMIAFINYINMILLAMIVVANLVITFTRAYASAGRVQEVLQTVSSITDGTNVSPEGSAPYAVEFEQVSFAYGDGEDELIDISFRIPRGAVVGVIGGTGSGKSTLMHLLSRFYDVREGRVKINGTDVREYPLEVLRSKIGLVPQKAELFTGTIADNIRWGSEYASDDEVREAARIAQAAEFIERMPMGYDSPVERGGANLSGGQKQRLTIARALVRHPDLLILDDSSSALDYVTDAAIRRAIRQTSRDMTVFIVSQRVSAVSNADILLVLNDGRLVGADSHERLLQSCEEYREICASQDKGEGHE